MLQLNVLKKPYKNEKEANSCSLSATIIYKKIIVVYYYKVIIENSYEYIG